MASVLKVDAEKLRPSDRFDCELARVFNLEDELDDLQDWVGIECKRRGISIRPQKPYETLDEVVRLLMSGR